MQFTQLIYASKPFGFDAGILDDILTKSRACNARDGITGALICRADLYLQMIEGPDAEIAATYARICGDDRHVDIQLILSRTVADRMFPLWAMRDDPPRSWMWSQADVSAGALQRAAPADILGIFTRLAAEIG
jgi:hypothetical protein